MTALSILMPIYLIHKNKIQNRTFSNRKFTRKSLDIFNQVIMVTCIISFFYIKLILFFNESLL